MTSFNGQHIEIFEAGSHVDDNGAAHEITTEFLESVANNFTPSLHEPPAVIGHPQTNSPAFGWVSGVRVENGKLSVTFKEVDPDFEAMVREGKFKKRSASFYIDPKTAPGGKAPALRHVGFLGALPPAVKGLKDIQFSEGESITFSEANEDFSEGDSMDEKDQKSLVDRIVEGIKSTFGGQRSANGDQAALHSGPAVPAFSESDAKKLVEDAVAKVTASFTEELKTRDTQIETLKGQVANQSGATTRAELINFVDKLGPAKCPPAFRNMGVVEFMESLAASDSKVTVISFSEEGGKKVETKTENTQLGWFQSFLGSLGPFIEFGEKFGAMKTTDATAAAVDPNRMNELRATAGLKTVEK